jgi:hypothetical protein
MSTTKSSSVITPSRDPFVIIRHSWVEICEGNHCAALLLNFLVSWHDWKLDHQPKAHWENDVAERHGDRGLQNTTLLQHHTASELKDGTIGMYGEKTILKAISILIDLGFIAKFRNPNPRYKFDQTHHYLVFPKKIQAALDRLSKSAESSQNDDISQTVNLPDESSKMTDGAEILLDRQVNLLNHYQDPLQSTFQSTDQKTNKHTDPKRGRAGVNDVVVEKYLDPDNSEHPENTPKSLEPPKPIIQPLVNTVISGEGESSAACDRVNGATTNHQARMSEAITPAIIEPIAQEIIDAYNERKPATWGECKQVTPLIKRNCESLIRTYRQDYPSMDEAIEAFKNDFKGATLACKASKFYSDTEFGQKNIAFLLNPLERDRLPKLSEQWNSQSEQTIASVSKQMDAEKNGIPDWQTGKILTGMMPYLRHDLYRKMLDMGHPQCPPLDYLHKYFPQLFTDSEGETNA